MEALIALNASLLAGLAIYLFQSRNLIRIFLGVFLISHALHLVVYLSGHSQSLTPAFVNQTTAQEVVSNPLTQALILTSIVISFAISLLCLGVVFAYQKKYRGVVLFENGETA